MYPEGKSEVMALECPEGTTKEFEALCLARDVFGVKRELLSIDT
jgi:hypothetical protein